LGGLIIGSSVCRDRTPDQRRTPPKCAALDDDYWDMVDLMLDVAPLGVQLRNRGGFNSSYVDVQEGEGGILHVDNDAIEDEWGPMYDELTQRSRTTSLPAGSHFQTGSRPSRFATRDS